MNAGRQKVTNWGRDWQKGHLGHLEMKSQSSKVAQFAQGDRIAQEEWDGKPR